MESSHLSSSRLDIFLKKPFSAILSLAVPILLGMGIHTFYNLADMYFIGKLGGQEIAAVAFNMPIFFFDFRFNNGFRFRRNCICCEVYWTKR